MEIKWGYMKTGWPSQMKWPGSISALTRNDRVFRFKIGVSGNPKTRVRSYGGFDDMVIVCSSQRRENALKIEKHLTRLYKDYCDNCDNQNSGGAGRGSEGPLHYVYIVRRFA